MWLACDLSHEVRCRFSTWHMAASKFCVLENLDFRCSNQRHLICTQAIALTLDEKKLLIGLSPCFCGDRPYAIPQVCVTLLPVSLDPGDIAKLLSLCGKAVIYKCHPGETHDSYKQYSYGKSTFTVLSRVTFGHPCHTQLEAGWPCQGPGVWTWRQAASMVWFYHFLAGKSRREPYLGPQCFSLSGWA